MHTTVFLIRLSFLDSHTVDNSLAHFCLVNTLQDITPICGALLHPRRTSLASLLGRRSLCLFRRDLAKEAPLESRLGL